VAFYRIKHKGDVDLEDVEGRLTGKVRALLIVHYFGFPQDVPELRNWCNGHSLFLIEDCAHSLLGTFEGKPLGSWGDLSIFSVFKTLPTVDGGLMVLNDPARKYSFDARQQRLLSVAKGAIRSWVLRRGPVIVGFDVEAADLEMHPLSERVLRCADAEGIVGRRRRNYAYLAEALRDGGLFVPHLPDLPEGACPSLFPIRVARDVRRVHAELVKQGIPVSVFPDELHSSFPREEFPFACKLADSLLCLPCHQDLDVSDMARMVGILRSVT
jgi:dTDP-4-amino-4,6-dideoxygalactose transaminase